jgi:hypothetical protein
MHDHAISIHQVLFVAALTWQVTLPLLADTTVNGALIKGAEVNAVPHESKQPDIPHARQMIQNQLIASVLTQQADEKLS